MSSLKEGYCPKCGSREIAPNLDAVEEKGVSVRVYENPGVTLRGMKNFPLKAWICTRCGYAELYVSMPDELAKSYRRFLAMSGA